MREPKFSFEPFNEAVERKKIERDIGFSVNVKGGYIIFPKKYVRDHNLDGSFIKWYLDVHKYTLGWKIFRKATAFTALKGYVQLKKNKATGTYLLYIRRLLKLFNFTDTNVTFRDLKVQKYISKLEYLDDGTLNYIELTDPVKLQPKQTKVK